MSAPASAVFSGRAIAWLAGLCGGSLLLAFLFAAAPGELGDPASAGANSYSWSLLGHRGFAELLQRSGHPVHRLRSHHAAGVDSAATVLLAEPRPVYTGEAGDSVEAARLARITARAGAVVLVLPKWIGAPDARHPAWLLDQDLLAAPRVLTPAVEQLAPGLELVRRDSLAATCDAVWGSRYTVALGHAQLLRPSGRLRPLITCDSLLLVAEVVTDARGKDGENKVKRGRVIVVADPDLLNNRGLGTADHAAILLDVFGRKLHAGGVAIDENAHGFGFETNLLAEMLRFPLVFALAQALLLAAFVVWAGLGRFGKPEAPAANVDGKRALVDTTATLLEMTGQAWETLRLYYLQTLQSIGECYYLPADLGERRLRARLVEISRERGIEQDVEEWSRTIERQRAAGGRPELVIRLAAGLHRWREEMTHDH